jgi:hypothetical protein
MEITPHTAKPEPEAGVDAGYEATMALEARVAEARDRADRRRLRRSILTAALSGVSALILLAAALYTDTASNGLDVNSSPTTVALTTTNMVGGSSVTGTLQVLNSGSLAMRYAIKSTTTENVLADQLDLTIKSGVSTCNTANFGLSGSVLYGPDDLGKTTGLNLVGDPAQGAQSGDRTLAGNANETLCLQVKLPVATGATYQGRTTTATIALIAEQTANNP